MSDMGRELAELKREVVESRNQAIKTDNQIKNLSLDVKSFEKRFDIAEQRAKRTHLGVHLVIAGTIAFAAYLLHAVQANRYEETITALRFAVDSQRQQSESRQDEVRQRLRQIEKQTQQREQAEKLSLQVLELLDQHKESEAGETIERLRMDQLSPLARKLVGPRLEDVRRTAYEHAMRQARLDLSRGTIEAAVLGLRRAVALAPDEKQSAEARTLLASQLWNLKHYDQVESLLRPMMERAVPEQAAGESAYYFATAMARIGRRAEALAGLNRIAASKNEFAEGARAYIQAIEAGGELPMDLPGGKIATALAPSGSAESVPAATASAPKPMPSPAAAPPSGAASTSATAAPPAGAPVPAPTQR